MWPPSSPSRRDLVLRDGRADFGGGVASIRSFGCAATPCAPRQSAFAVVTAFVPVTSDGTHIREEQAVEPAFVLLRGMSMLPFFWAC